MRRIGGAATALALLGRGVFRPPPAPASLERRLADIAVRGAPVRSPVTIHWDAHQIPFIEADSDEDLAVALGVVHAHLRLGQMEMLRRLALGRVAEAVGGLGLELDRALRLMGFGRAVPGIIGGLSPATRAFAEGFVRGVNHQAAHGPLPHEFVLLGLRPEPWTLEHLFTTARLVGADVTWLVLSRLLRLRRGMAPDAWAALWPRLLSGGAAPTWPAPGQAEEAPAEEALARAGRHGSNSCAVAARRAAGGAAMIASDPHLSLALPNLWLIAGFRSPGLHAVGLMLPGFPFVALGRNPWIAWGGTSLHAASSDLFDLSGLPPGRITTRHETIRVRWGRPRRVALRESPAGPVVSDGMLFRDRAPLALRWVGHRPSDELGAMLGVARARNWEEFRAALAGFALPGQTMVFADTDGRVGRVTAAHLPRRRPEQPADLVLPADRAWTLEGLADARELPARFDPPDGFVVSANEAPEGATFPIGFFFSLGSRVARMRELLGGAQRLSMADLRALQRDLRQDRVRPLRDTLLAAARTAPGADTPHRLRVLRVLAGWDAAYDTGSRGALVFESLVATLARGLRGQAGLAPYAAIWATRSLIARDLMEAPRARLHALLPGALDEAAAALRRHGAWGGMHRMRLAHHFAALPLLGRRYVFREYPAEGGNETLEKAGHGLARRRPHTVGFGSCARHISDLADPDANFFVLLGGQDGWIGSQNFLDQVPLWRAGRTVQVPLRPETARARFPHRTVLRPEAGPGA